MTVLELACSERGLNTYLDKKADSGEKILRLRNLGGDARTIPKTIKFVLEAADITKIRVITHEDCGAMKKTLEHLNGKEYNGHYARQMLKPFEKNWHLATDYSEQDKLKFLEDINPDIQRINIEKIIGHARLNIVPIETENISKQDLDRSPANVRLSLIVTPPLDFNNMKYFSATNRQMAEQIDAPVNSAYIIKGMVPEELFAATADAADWLRIPHWNVKVIRLGKNSYEEGYIVNGQKFLIENMLRRDAMAKQISKQKSKL